MQNFIKSAKSKLHPNIPQEFHLDNSVVDEKFIGDDRLNPHLKAIDWAFDFGEFRPAAVLVAVVNKPNPTVILTRRPMHMKKHPGQIALPGGKLEISDADAKDAALREANEEIGLDRKYVNVLGYLDIYQVRTGFRICPVVATVDEGYELTADANEVDEIFELPLDFLLSENNYKIHTKSWNGNQHQFYALEFGEYFVWGATAGMLKNLSDKLRN